MSLSAYLTSIADAIRAKKGTTDPINAQDFASEIASIEGGGGVSFITSDGLEFNCITSWEECLDSNGDVLLDENGAPLMSGKYGSFTVTVKDRLQDINELPAIEDVNNILVYKTPIKSTDTVCLVKSEPRKEAIDVIPYSVTETEVTVVDAGGVKMSGVVVMAGHTSVTSPVAVTGTNVTVYADMDGEWVYTGSEWLPITILITEAGLDASTYKGMTTDAPTTSSTPGLYLHFNKYYSPREVAITNISEQYVAEGGSITINYVDELSDVTSPVVSQDDLNPVLYITPQKVYTYNGVKYEDWCETVLDSFFKGKTSEFPTKDSADGVYFVRSVTPVSFGIPTTNADIFQNIEGVWKQLSHRRVVDASKFPKPGETGVSGGGASSEKVEVIIGADGAVFTLGLLLTMQASMTSTTTLVDDHTSVTSPETSTATNVIAYVDNTGVWAYDGESWVDVLKTMLSGDIHYFGVHTSLPDIGLEDTWAFAFVSEQTNGSIWMANGAGMCADMTSMLELELGLRPTSWIVVSDHAEVTSPEGFDMATTSGPVYVDNTDIWAYVPDNGGWMGLMRDIMGMPEDYVFAILTEPPTADSPMGMYFVPVEISGGGAMVDSNFVPYDEDLIYKVTTKEGETNLYQVYDIGNGTIKVQDERKYNAQFSGTLDFIFVEDHTTVEDPIISKELNSTTYYVDGNEIWYFANPGGWIRKCSSYSIVSEPPTVESAIGYYLVKATESVGIGVADPDASVSQMVCGDPWASVNFGGTIFDFIYIMSQFKDTTATSYKIVNDISEVTDTNFVYLIKNTQTVAYIDVNGNLDRITPALAAEQGYTYKVVSKRSEAVAVPNKIGYYACFGELDWKDLTGTITTLEGQVEELGEQITTLETEVDGLETENNNLETRVNNLRAEKTTLTTKVNNLTAEKSNLTTQVNNLTAENNNLETQIDTLESEKTSLQFDLDATIPSMNFMRYAVLSGSEDGIALVDVTNANIESINIHSSVTSIGADSFSDNAVLTSIIFENGSRLMSIDDGAFSGCNSLANVYYGGTEEEWGVISIGSSNDSLTNAMRYYYSETKPMFNADGTAFNGNYWYYNTHGGIDVWDEGKFFSEGLQYTLNSDNASYSVTGCGTCTDTVVAIRSTHNGLPVTSIGSYAFAGYKNLASIAIPDSVISIGERAFNACSQLTSITIPDSVTSIGKQAFYDCTNLTNIYVTDIAAWCNISGLQYFMTYGAVNKNLYLNGALITELVIPNGVTSIGNYAFANCNSLTSVVIPGSLTEMGYEAFHACSSLMDVVIHDGVPSIGDWSFAYCTNLMSITIPGSITRINGNAFYSCRLLKNIYITDIAAWCNISGVENIMSVGETSKNLYLNNEIITELIIPNGVTSINDWAFRGCGHLRRVVIPDSVTSIGKAAFSGCTSLTSITIPDSVTSIGDSAFSNCVLLTSISIPEGVTSINKSTFYYCSNLRSVTIPSSVTSIGDDAFISCTGLYKVVNRSDLVLTLGGSDNGYVACYAKILEDKDGNVTCIQDDKEYIETEDQFLFTQQDGNYTLIAYLGSEETVTLPTNINGNAYKIYKMRGVHNVVIPSDIAAISNYAFSSCNTLTSVIIGDGITSIGDRAFDCCYNLTSIVIPNSVTSIGSYAFFECRKLTSIDLPDHITTVGFNTLSWCRSLTSIVIPDNVTYINRSAIAVCSNLTSVQIPVSVTYVDEYALADCPNLTSITFTGTMEQWNAITKVSDWNKNTGNYTIHCTDGDIAKES